MVAAGCLAERYGAELAEALPEADAVLGFDSYADIATLLDDVVSRTFGRTAQSARPPHAAADGARAPPRRSCRPDAAARPCVAAGRWRAPNAARRRPARRTSSSPPAATGVARSARSRPSAARSSHGRRRERAGRGDAGSPCTACAKLVLVSENSTSYGKDFGDLQALERLLPQLAAVDGIERVRVSYLQPAELRPSLLEAIATASGLAAYFDLSFQHASPTVLRRMKRFGSTESFLQLLAAVRDLAPEAGARSNVIVGFPGETESDLDELARFLTLARLDAIGVFGYSDEDGTAAAGFDGKLDRGRDRGAGRARQRLGR